MKWDIPRLAITMTILGAFCYALGWRYTNGIEETLKSIVMLAVGYWLAKNDNAERATENTGKFIDLASKTLDTPPTTSVGNLTVEAENVDVTRK